MCSFRGVDCWCVSFGGRLLVCFFRCRLLVFFFFANVIKATENTRMFASSILVATLDKLEE